MLFRLCLLFSHITTFNTRAQKCYIGTLIFWEGFNTVNVRLAADLHPGGVLSYGRLDPYVSSRGAVTGIY